jgi:hypothetical protein
MVTAFLIIYLPESIQSPLPHPTTKSSEKYGVILLSYIKMKTCVTDTVMTIKDCEGSIFIFWWWGQGAVVMMVAMVPAVMVLVSVTAVLL